MYRVVSRGIPLTKDFRIFLEKDKQVISAWRDVPLRPTTSTVHMVTEIPAQSRAKFEIAVDEELHPLKQDLNNQNTLRFLVPKMPCNYGALPQTLSLGDGDPLDVLDLAPMHLGMTTDEGVGKVRRVRVLGGFCLLDQGEEDWKILGVDEDAAIPWKNAGDIPKDLIDNLFHWFKTYKTFEGKKLNSIKGGSSALLGVHEIDAIIQQAHANFAENGAICRPTCEFALNARNI